MAELRKYGVGATFIFPLFEAGTNNFKLDAAHASGDSVISKDEGAQSNTTNGFVDEGSFYSIALTSTEMEAARIAVVIIDQGTKAYDDQMLVIETYGHASAQHEFDLDAASTPQTGDTYALANGANGFAAIKGDTVDIEADTQDIQSRIPAALSSGNMKVDVFAMQANVMTAAAAASDLTTELQSGLATAANLATLQTTANDILTDTAEIGAAGAGLTAINLPDQTMNITGNITGNLSGSVGSVTGLTVANLDVAISTRMASYTQPTGFLAATFPGTVASTTNITAGTITTTTNLTNLPTIPANWLTAAGTAADFTTEIQNGLATAAALATVDGIADDIKAVTVKLDTALVLDGAVYQYTANALELAPSSSGGGLDADGVRAAIGLASANLDTQLSTIDTVVDAIKAKTDSLTFSVAGQVDANTESMNGAEILGNGSSGNLWRGA